MNKTIVTFLKYIFPLIIALVFFVAVSDCQSQEGIIEQAGKQIDEGVGAVKDAAVKPEEKAGEAVEAPKDTAAKPEEKAGEGKDESKNLMDKGMEKMQEGMDKMKSPMDVVK